MSQKRIKRLRKQLSQDEWFMVKKAARDARKLYGRSAETAYLQAAQAFSAVGVGGTKEVLPT